MDKGEHPLSYYLKIYFILAGVNTLFLLFKTTLLARLCAKASFSLHDSLLHNIFRVPVSFFDTTPLGRIINRFGKDINDIDVALPESLAQWLVFTLFCIGTVITIICLVPYLAIGLAPLGRKSPLIPLILSLVVLYIWMQKLYIPVVLQMSRLHSVSRSPIFSHFGESISGAMTIRAFKATSRFIHMFEEYLNTHTSVHQIKCWAEYWLHIRTGIINSFFLAIVAGCIVYFRNISPGLFMTTSLSRLTLFTTAFAGLCFAYTVLSTNNLLSTLEQTAKMESQLNGVERIINYTNIEQERPHFIPSNAPPPEWPTYLQQ